MIRDRSENRLRELFLHYEENEIDNPIHQEITTKIGSINVTDGNEKSFRKSFAPRIHGMLHVDSTSIGDILPGNVYLYDEVKEILPQQTETDENLEFKDWVTSDSAQKGKNDELAAAAPPLFPF